MTAKRIWSLVISLTLILGLAAGCSTAGSSTSSGSGSSVQGGASSGSGTVPAEDITLTWYAYLPEQESNAAVFAKADEMVKEALGFNLKIIALQEYHVQMPLLIASGEDIDIMYTATTTNSYSVNVAEGNLLELDDLLPEYAPGLWEGVDEDVWNAIRVNGKIYAIPNQQIMARGPAWWIPTQNIELLGLDVDGYKTMADFEEYLQAVYDETGKYTLIPAAWATNDTQYWGIEQVIGAKIPGAIRVSESEPQVISQYDSEEFVDYIGLRRKWVENGLAAPMYVKEGEYTQFADRFGKDQIVNWLGWVNTVVPGWKESFEKSIGLEITLVAPSTPLMYTGAITATMQAVYVESRHPEQAVSFLGYLNTNPDLMNLLAYGIEDVNYKKTGENKIEKLNSSPYNGRIWATGNTFLTYLLEGQPDNTHAATMERNATAKRSPILGFAANSEPVKLEITNCTAVLDEYVNSLDQGLLDLNTAYPEFMNKLKTAGADKIVSELNKQLAAWRASK